MRDERGERGEEDERSGREKRRGEKVQTRMETYRLRASDVGWRERAIWGGERSEEGSNIARGRGSRATWRQVKSQKQTR